MEARTTVRLNESLLAQVKQLAEERHTTFTALVEESLRNLLSGVGAAKVPAPKKPLTTYGGSGLQPGVDLRDWSALMDVMEDGHAPS